MAKKTTEEKINLDSILFKCRDILRKARNSGSFFEKRDMMLTLVFLRFIGEKFEDGTKKLRQDLIEQGLDPDDEAIVAAFFDDATFTDGTYNLPVEARWSTIINTPAPKLNVALDTALHSIATNSPKLKGCFNGLDTWLIEVNDHNTRVYQFEIASDCIYQPNLMSLLGKNGIIIDPYFTGAVIQHLLYGYKQCRITSSMHDKKSKRSIS